MPRARLAPNKRPPPSPKKFSPTTTFLPPCLRLLLRPRTPQKKTDGQSQADDKSGKKELDPEDDPKQEAYWHKKAAKLRAKLSTAEQELDVLQRELSKDEVQYYPDPQKALMQQYNRSDINEKHAKVDAKKAEVETLKQQVADLEDNVRKAGGDPGWVR